MKDINKMFKIYKNSKLQLNIRRGINNKLSSAIETQLQNLKTKNRLSEKRFALDSDMKKSLMGALS